MVKNLPASTGNMGLERFPGGGNGNPPQDSCLENSMDREACQTAVQGGHKEVGTTGETEQAHMHKADIIVLFLIVFVFYVFKVHLIWTIFQVFIEFVNVLLLFHVLIFSL